MTIDNNSASSVSKLTHQITRIIPASVSDPSISAPQSVNFLFDEEVLKAAKRITLSDLLNSGALEDVTIAHLLKLISHAKANLVKTPDKDDAEKILQVDLQDLYFAIGQEVMDAAFTLPMRDRGAA